VTKLETDPTAIEHRHVGNSVTLTVALRKLYVESHLSGGNSWTSNEVAVSNIGLSNILTLPLSGDRTFYRLKRP
jgi:hypothetical protein